MIACPACKAEVQPDWDWCYACGWDPEGLRPAGIGPAATAAGYPPPNAPRAPVAPPRAMTPPPYGAAPGYGAPPYGAPSSYPQPGSGRSAGGLILRVALIGGTGLIAIVVVSVLAVTLLGTSTKPVATGPTTTVTTSKPAPTQWQRWTASDASFSIEFPTPPVILPMEDVPPEFVTTEEAVAEYGETDYGVFYFELSPDYYFDDPFPTMNSILDGLGEDVGITYSSRTRGNLGLLPSLSFTGSVRGGAGTVQGVVAISERRLFAMYTIAFEGELVDHDHFVGSFTAG